ncbi:hypothetical protein BDQ17DRAFT_1431157 [Cyathus striatus]|nr:hypothetical protein BDQ17DRAFT_1431157 [Cyathus striatus]
MPSQNSKKTNAPVSPPTSCSGLVCTELPVSRGCKCTQSTVNTTAESATKKPAITADEEAADIRGKGRWWKGKRWEKEGESKSAGDKDKEDKAASNAANKDKSKA